VTRELSQSDQRLNVGEGAVHHRIDQLRTSNQIAGAL
jgi:hypothetical protein